MNDDGLQLNRKSLIIKPNEYVQYKKQVYRISQVIDFEKLVGVEVESLDTKILKIQDLTAPEKENSDNELIYKDLNEISDADWLEAQKAFEIIQPLLKNKGRKEVEKRAKQYNKNHSTLYRWIKKYSESGSIASLIKMNPGSRPGTSRLSEEQEEAIKTAIDSFYLHKQRYSIDYVIKEVQTDCEKRNIAKPCNNTIRSRIYQISDHNKFKYRLNSKKAKDLYEPTPGTFPHANYPLSVVQIDHTPMDIILVDDEERLPIGRPWITLAIDVYSRVVTGYYLTFDPPSGTSVACCIAHSILPKENWLETHGVDSTWAIWGVMQTIHTDNGADFRAKTLSRSCLNYNINLEFRPVKKAHFGGHIERLLGTILTKVHNLPGTTFANITDRLDYDSDKNACMSFSEFEKWLLTFIVKVYHKKKHSGIGMPPENKWKIGIFGDTSTEGIGLFPRPNNPETVLIDFLPIVERTIRTQGVNLDNLFYYDHALRPWINYKNKDSTKNKKFMFRRDHRDITYLWFQDPIEKKYYKIPLANQAIPPTTIWELRAAKKRAKEDNIPFSADYLLKCHQEERLMVSESEKKTKKARLERQKKSVNENAKKNTQVQSVENNSKSTKIEVDDFWGDDVDSFE